MRSGRNCRRRAARLASRLSLVTTNLGEFARVRRLLTESWIEGQT
jgi:hypothetical protein